MTKIRVFCLLAAVLLLLSACSSSLPDDPDQDHTLPTGPQGFDNHVGKVRLLADRPSEMVSFDLVDPFTNVTECQRLTDVTLKSSRHNPDEDKEIDTVICTVIARNDHYQATSELTYVYSYSDPDQWTLESVTPSAPIQYEVLINPLRESAANARPGYELINSSFSNGGFLFNYRRANEKAVCTLLDTRTVRANFDGHQWRLSEDAATEATDWQVIGDWSIDHRTWDGYHLESQLHITDFDWANQTISGSWHVRVTWLTNKLDDTVTFEDEPILVNGISSFSLPAMFRYSAFFSDQELELNVNEDSVRINTTLHSLFQDGVYVLSKDN